MLIEHIHYIRNERTIETNQIESYEKKSMIVIVKNNERFKHRNSKPLSATNRSK